MRAGWAFLALMGLVHPLACAPALAVPACPTTTATLAILVDNRSADQTVSVSVSGDLLDPAATCAGDGATSYAGVFTCAGSPTRPCVTITELRPGAWVNRLSVTVQGSDPQVQARRMVVAAGRGAAAATFLTWTVYPKTFVVGDTTEAALRAELTDAATFTAGGHGPALVTFAPAAFPGAASPRTIALARGECGPEPLKHAALCVTASHLVVDGLDARGARGGVVLSVVDQPVSLIRVYGGDDVFRGLVLRGTQATGVSEQLDAVSFVGADAVGDRLEDVRVEGPIQGDAVSVEASAVAALDRVELLGAADKGLKVTTGAEGTISASCVHDNANGGIQSTLGGNVVAFENVVQRNVPGPAGNGISVGNRDPATPSMLVTRGNVIRFAGNRGISVTDASVAHLEDDYVSDNQFAGAKVETTSKADVASVPAAVVRGAAFVCNHRVGISGSCKPEGADEAVPCATDADCCRSSESSVEVCCASDAGCATPARCGAPSFPRGFGVAIAAAAGHGTPAVSLGDDDDLGGNAFALNRNTAVGANLNLNADDLDVPAVGNQWEHCGDTPTCDAATIAEIDVRIADGKSATFTLGAPVNARPAEPSIRAVTPLRPARNDVVRVYGEGFDAIDAARCAEDVPADLCSIENPAVAQASQQLNTTRLRLIAAGNVTLQTFYPDVVTPRMVAFRMPFDCFAPLTLQVAKQDLDQVRLIATVPLCDASGCAGAPDGVACDDGDVGTTDDRCTAGTCAGTPILCTGPCYTGTMNPDGSCVPKDAGTACEDGDACSVRDTCDANGRCVAGPARVCKRLGRCASESCDPSGGCLPEPAGTICRSAATPCDVAETCNGSSFECPPDLPAPAMTPCDDGNECTIGDHCTGSSKLCAAGPGRVSCDDANPCTTDACLPGLGCAHANNTASCDDGDPCTDDRCSGGACVGVPRVGLDLAVCRLESPLADPLCGGEPVRAGLRRGLSVRLVRATRLVQRAIGRTRPTARGRLLQRADQTLATAQRTVARWSRAGTIPGDCADVLDQVVGQRRLALEAAMPP